MNDHPMGPYELARDTHQAPLLRDIAAVAPRPGAYPPIIQRHLIAACREAGLTLGSYDARILTWIARWEPETAQTLIGLISRAHAAGLARRLAVRFEEAEKLRAEAKEWSDLAYELYALACNSTTDGTGKPEDWTACFERLRDRFHAALDTLPPTVTRPQPSTEA